MSLSIEDSVKQLGAEPLNEESLRKHIWPQFSRVLSAQKTSGEIYLANHSLGRPLDQTERDVMLGLQLWYSKLDDAWEDEGWPHYMIKFRELVAKLIGLSRSDCIIPKTSAGQGLRAVLNSFPANKKINVVATCGEFDSIDHILKTYSVLERANVSFVKPSRVQQQIPLFESDVLINSITPETDLVVLSQVFFSTGQLFPNLDSVVNRAHELGALVLVDAYHSAGVIPVEMEKRNFDFVIGGSYKYVRGGPGAAWLAIHPKHVDKGLRTLDTGWFAKDGPFQYERFNVPKLATDGDAWLESTPPVISCFQALAGLEFILAMGIDRIRDYSLRQQATLRSAFESNGVHCFCPINSHEFGAFSLLPATDAPSLSKSLKAKGITTDARGGTVRFGPDILNSEEELQDAALITSQLLV